jgi:hypothetical protein
MRCQMEPELEIPGSFTRAGNKAYTIYGGLIVVQVIFHHLRYNFSPATMGKL